MDWILLQSEDGSRYFNSQKVESPYSLWKTTAELKLGGKISFTSFLMVHVSFCPYSSPGLLSELWKNIRIQWPHIALLPMLLC